MDTYDSNLQDNQPPQEATAPSQLQPDAPTVSRIPPQAWTPAAQAEPSPLAEQPQPVQPGFAAAEDGSYRFRQSDSPKPSPYANSPYASAPVAAEGYRYQPRTAPPAKQPRKKGAGIWTVLISMVLAVALAAACSLGTAQAVANRWQEKNDQAMEAMQQQLDTLQQQLEAAQARPQTPSAPVTGSSVGASGMTPAQVYYENYASVVTVRSTVQNYGQSVGSGFVLTQDGYVVTNYHVIEGATSVVVVLHDDTALPATVVGTDSANDVAVLKTEGEGLVPVKLGSSSSACVGDMVVAIGNPLGELNFTQTVGYICGKDREVTTGGTILNMLQIDAAINSGNSGGPLFNMNGEVIGITTAKYSGVSNSGATIEGIGFAIPIDDVMGIIDDLKDFGYVTGAYLGVVVQNMSEEIIDTLGTAGAMVIQVEPGYAAERAGLSPKDIIVAFDGHEIRSITDLTRLLRSYQPGDTATVTVIRSFVKLELTVTLDEKPRPEVAIPLP